MPNAQCPIWHSDRYIRRYITKNHYRVKAIATRTHHHECKRHYFSKSPT
ncbi:hypothetical protein H6G41_25580 [Tolypothrix sp. FACHB-123]|nr:hypothetical protein [Tolypothrix sp. FACHB-123]MBD2357943.1 hypothetical protein [Tolypothrix sp. FACHB-123]